MSARKYLYYLQSIVRLLTGVAPAGRVLRLFLGLAPDGVHQIRLRREGTRFQVRGPMDVWSVKETFLDRFYERHGVRIQNDWQVMDIGAGIGDFSLFASLGFPQNQVYACEPYPESFKLLEENLALNQATQVQAFPWALAGHSGLLALDDSGGEPLQVSGAGLALRDGRVDFPIVPALSLEDAWTRLGLERLDVLKLDCEGAEYPILRHAPPAILSQIRHIVMEYHDFIPGHHHQELVAHLSGLGFRTRLTPNRVHSYLGYLHAYKDYSP